MMRGKADQLSFKYLRSGCLSTLEREEKTTRRRSVRESWMTVCDLKIYRTTRMTVKVIRDYF